MRREAAWRGRERPHRASWLSARPRATAFAGADEDGCVERTCAWPETISLHSLGENERTKSRREVSCEDDVQFITRPLGPKVRAYTVGVYLQNRSLEGLADGTVPHS